MNNDKNNINLCKKYNGFYRGKVVQCLNNGFCRIQIPDILESIDGDINTLPPAEPAQTIGGGGNTLNGSFTYPALGSIVWCFFEGGNLERPVYFAMSNTKSSKWDSVSIPTPANTNKGNDGVSIFPSGDIKKFNKSIISQTSVIDPKTGESKGDVVDINIESTYEQDNIYNQNVISNDPDSNEFPSPLAASIHLDNINNIVSLTAKNAIVLHAPNIVIDSTGFGGNGSILLLGNSIENVTNNGPFRVIGAKVNIDSGTNDIILQTHGEIYELTPSKMSETNEQ